MPSVLPQAGQKALSANRDERYQAGSALSHEKERAEK